MKSLGKILRAFILHGLVLFGFVFLLQISEAQAQTLTQSAYRWFGNQDAATPTAALAAQDTAATLSTTSEAFRLRMLMHVASSTAPAPSWATSTIQTASDVGYYTSIDAVDANTIYISHLDNANADLLFAKSTNGGSTWATSTIQTASDVGYYTSIDAVDANTIYVSHRESTNGDLLFAKSTDGGSTWATSTIQTAGNVGWESSIDAVDANTIYVSHRESTNGDLLFAKSTNGGSTWATSTIQTAGNVGLDSSIDAVDANTIYISHLDNTNGDLLFAKSTNGGSTWATSTIQTAGNVGWFSSIAAIDANTIYISHLDVTNGDLLFAKSTNGGSTWATSTIQTAGNVGWHSSIDAVDANTIFISHRDDTNGDLLFAKSTNGGSTWATSTIQTAGNVGLYSSIDAVDANTIYISHQDNTNADLLFAKFSDANTFKLQYSQKSGTCDTGFVGETYQDISSSSPIIFRNNPSLGDGIVMATTTADPTHGSDTIVAQSYEEAAPFTNPNAIPVGQDGLWDFALFDNNAASSTSWCFRAVKSDDSLLNTYSVIPALTVFGPVFTQEHYRWYENTNAITPTAALADLDTTATGITPQTAVRLRMNIGITSQILNTSTQAFKLQFATATSGPWTDVGGTSSSVIWRGANNSSVSDGATLTSTLIASSTAAESYEESNNSISNPTAVAVGDYGEWDWVLENNGATAKTTYYFRLAKPDDTAFQAYSRYPSLVTAAGGGGQANTAPIVQNFTVSQDPVIKIVNFSYEVKDREQRQIWVTIFLIVLDEKTYDLSFPEFKSSGLSLTTATSATTTFTLKTATWDPTATTQFKDRYIPKVFFRLKVHDGEGGVTEVDSQPMTLNPRVLQQETPPLGLLKQTPELPSSPIPIPLSFTIQLSNILSELARLLSQLLELLQRLMMR